MIAACVSMCAAMPTFDVSREPCYALAEVQSHMNSSDEQYKVVAASAIAPHPKSYPEPGTCMQRCKASNEFESCTVTKAYCWDHGHGCFG